MAESGQVRDTFVSMREGAAVSAMSSCSSPIDLAGKLGAGSGAPGFCAIEAITDGDLRFQGEFYAGSVAFGNRGEPLQDRWAQATRGMPWRSGMNSMWWNPALASRVATAWSCP